MQRFFSTFPDRWPGIGLLWMRIVVGGAVVLQAGIYLAMVSDPSSGRWTASLAAVIAGGFLIIGLLTPGAAIASALSTPFIASGIHEQLPLDPTASLLAAAIAAAIALTGPGAISVDARLFGRREIVIPRSSPPHTAHL